MSTEPTPRTVLTTIGGWKLGKTLGRGAYAHVRLATHRNGHKAACKILPALHRPRSTPATWDEVIDAVEAHKELVLLKALAGSGIEGIVGLEGVIVEGGWTYVFLTLYNHSASTARAPWPRNRLVPFFRSLCHTIHSLHLLGVGHEDLKRSNILIDDRGRPIAVDFGFSQFNPHGKRVKSAGGTLDYSSPEKVKDSMYDSRANDVWSLAILLIKLLGLPHPFAESGYAGPSAEASKRMKERISSRTPNLDWMDGPRRPQHTRDLVDLLCQMLQKDPKRRITIPDILAHPYLLSRDTQALYAPPDYNLPPDVPSPLPVSVLEDICFLAYINKAFFLCESPQKIEHRVFGPDKCWEKRWAGFLCRWKQSPEMLYEDAPDSAAVLVTETSSRTPMPALRALREIHLSPNIPNVATTRLAGPKITVDATQPSEVTRTRAGSRRPIIVNMKPRVAPPTPSVLVSDHDRSLSNITVASTMPKAPNRASTQRPRPMKTPDRVDFRAKTLPAPLLPTRTLNANIPDLDTLKKQLEESAVATLIPTGDPTVSPSTQASKVTSKRSESSLENGEDEENGRQAPPAKKAVGKKPQPRRGKAKGPPRRLSRVH